MKKKLGALKLDTQKLVCGVGINDADYAVTKWETIGYVNGKRKQKQVWICPFYQVWKGKLQRCYSAKFQEKYPTYKGCSVSEEWLTFSNFKSWMECQGWEGMQLDKDLLLEGNKVYSAETCVFVTSMVNSFTTDCGASRGECLLGVHWNKREGKFKSSCSNPFTKKREHLGYFTREEEAHQAWLMRKLELAYDVLNGLIDSPVGSSDHYHTVYVNPSWSKHLNYTYHVGNHIFYEE